MKYLLIRESDGLVENIIELSETSNYSPPNGYALWDFVESINPGDTWDGKNIIPKKVPNKAEELSKTITNLKTFTTPISEIVSAILNARGLKPLTEDEKILLNNALITLSSRGQLPV